MTDEQKEVLKEYQGRIHELYYEVLGNMDTTLMNQSEQTLDVAKKFEELFANEGDYVESVYAFRQAYNNMIEAQKLISKSRAIFSEVHEFLEYKKVVEGNN